MLAAISLESILGDISAHWTRSHIGHRNIIQQHLKDQRKQAYVSKQIDIASY